MAFPPPANVFVNFEASSRKPMLIPFGLFSPTDNLGFIYTIPSAGGTGGSPQPMIGTIDGVNAVFTTPVTVINGAAIYSNGILQDPSLSYTLVGSTVTFNAANIPQPGDDLSGIIS